jgi:Tol biopolymer transport system component
VGDAGQLQQKGKLHLAAGLFPEGTEFLSTLRYLDISDDGQIRPSERIKEIRYLKKRKWLTYAQLELNALDEIKEKHDFQDRLKVIFSDPEKGASNGKGWVLQGFIEDENGRLRPQSVEENKSCVGCHGGIGATTDSVFSMARKLDASQYRQGWYHWRQKDMAGLNEPKAAFGNAGVQYEYCFYLIYGQAGDAFRANDEVLRDFFDAGGHLRPEMAAKIHDDLSILLYPSKSRALALDKAYRTIVKAQSYTMGRSAIVGKATHMFDRIQPKDVPTGVKRPVALTRFPNDVVAPHRPDVEPTAAAKVGQAAIDGLCMAGPDGRRYQIDGQGLIDESSYALDQSGYYFPFPSRQTLPTRIIVPNAGIPACYKCHRLDAAMPPGITQVKTPVPLGKNDSKDNDRRMMRLTDHAGVDTYGVWSPDGKQIAWVSDRREGYQIWTMRADGSHKKQITRGPAIHGWPAWSPDNKQLVYWGFDPQSGRSTISVCRAGGTDAFDLVASQDALDRPQWRPDGKYVAYAWQHTGNWDIWVAAGDGSRFYQMTHDAQMETNPLWRPDGLSIAYKVAPDKAYNLTIENFMTVKDGFDAPQYRMWDGIKSIQMNDWSPDGNKIAYTAEAVTNASGRDRVSYVAVVEDISLSGRKTSGTPVVLAQGATLGDRGPVFSPDGRRIAFWAWDTAYRATLWTADADGSNLTRLTTDGDDMYPTWRPDGKAILFESARGGSMDIWTLSVD